MFYCMFKRREMPPGRERLASWNPGLSARDGLGFRV